MPSIKVAFISNAIPFDGGADTFENSFAEILRLTVENFDVEPVFIRTDFKFTKRILARANNSNKNYFKVGLYTKLLIACQTSLMFSSLIARIRFTRNRFEKFLISKDIQVAVFLSPNPLALIVNSIPIATTIWDLGHRDLPNLTEFSKNNNFREREFYYQNTLPRSSIILVDSEATKKRIEFSYGVQSSKILIIGLLPKCPVVKNSVTSENNLEKYIFYPAQFWSHKNHLRLVEAFKLVLKEQPEIKLFLSGSDKGTLAEVMAHVEKNGLSGNVAYLGFVSKDMYWSLLTNCECLVFPSLLGPTNLPPLEALMVGKRMAISNFHEENMQAGSQEIFYFDPLSIDSIAQKILQAISGTDFEPFSFEVQNRQNVSKLLEEVSRIFL